MTEMLVLAVVVIGFAVVLGAGYMLFETFQIRRVEKQIRQTSREFLSVAD